MTGVYILECADGTLYTGATKNLTNRLQRHTLGKAAKYTRSRLPINLVYWEPHDEYSSALRREAVIKKMNKNKKLGLLNSSAEIL
jgi:putative endonuclease